MLIIDVFAEFKKRYHASALGDGIWHIAPDCPPDRVEELRVEDAKFFEEQGYHLCDIFMDETDKCE